MPLWADDEGAPPSEETAFPTTADGHTARQKLEKKFDSSEHLEATALESSPEPDFQDSKEEQEPGASDSPEAAEVIPTTVSPAEPVSQPETSKRKQVQTFMFVESEADLVCRLSVRRLSSKLECVANDN